MSQEIPSEFACFGYGDDCEVNFYGPPIDGFLFDCLSISEMYLAPIFMAISDRFPDHRLPRFVFEWHTCTGWRESAGLRPVADDDVRVLIEALRTLQLSDLTPHENFVTPDDCLRCVEAMTQFFRVRLNAGFQISVEA